MDDGAGSGPIRGVGLSLDGLADSLGDLGPALDAMAQLGVDSVEIFLPSLGVVLGGRVHRQRLRELRRLCAGRPFALTLHGPLSADLGDGANRTLQRDVCRAGLEAAGEVGAGLYVQHQTIAPDPTPDTVAARLACERESLALLAPAAANAGAVLAVETMFCHRGEWTALPHELAAQIAAVDHPAIGAVFDFGHGFLNATTRKADFLASAKALAPHVRHIHIHDNFARPPAFRPWSRGDGMSFGFGDLHLPPGDGALPWDALAALPYGGPATANLEVDMRWRPEWPACIAFVRDWIARAAATAPTVQQRAEIG